MFNHYIRVNQNGVVVHGYSSAYEDAKEGDICILENAGRQFMLLGIVNPNLSAVHGVKLYKYENGTVSLRTEDEILAEQTSTPKMPNQNEMMFHQLTTLMVDGKKKDMMITSLMKNISEMNIKLAQMQTGGI